MATVAPFVPDHDVRPLVIVNSELAHATGAKGLALRLTEPRFRFPPGGAAAVASVPDWPPRSRLDNVALFVGLVLVPLLALPFALVPRPDPLAGAPSLAVAAQATFPVMPLVLSLLPCHLSIIDEKIGGMQFSFRAHVAAILCLGVVNTCIMAALGWRPLLALIHTMSYVFFTVVVAVAIASSSSTGRSSWRRLVGVLQTLAEAIGFTMVLVVGYVVAFDAADSALARLALALAYDLAMWGNKIIGRRLFPFSAGLIGTEMWQDGLGHAFFVLSLPYNDDGSLAVIVLAQVWGAALPALLHSERLLPLYTRIAGAPAPGGRERICMHIVVTAHTMVLVAAHRVGPNSAYSSMGQWPSDVADRAMRIMGIWVATFVVVGVVGCAIFRARWGIDARALALDALSGTIVQGIGAIGGVMLVQQQFTTNRG